MSDSRNDESSKNALILFLGALAFIVLCWYLMRDYIALSALILSKLNFNFLTMLHEQGGFGRFVIWCLFPSRFLSIDSLTQLQELYRTVDVNSMSNADIYDHLTFAGYSIRWIALLFGVFFMVFIFVCGKVQRKTNRYTNFNNLLEYSKETFPHLKPALAQDLLNKNPDIGLYRREESPIRFAINNRLVKAYQLKRKGVLKNNQPVYVSITNEKGLYCLKDDISNHISKIHDLCEFEYKTAENVFIKQLGKRFTSVENLSIEKKAMMAVFIAFYSPDYGKEKAFELLKQFNHSWNWKKVHDKDGNLIPTIKNDFINTNGIDAIITNGLKNEFIAKAIASHAYEDTMLCSLLQLARTKGKLWSAFWYWLLPVNRTLFWALDAMGGHTSWTEAAAVFSHYKAELKFETPLVTPFITPAVEGLYYYLDQTEGWIMSKESKELYFPNTDEEY